MEQINVLQNEIEYIINQISNLQKHIQLLQQEIKTIQLNISTKLIQQNNLSKEITLIQSQIYNIQLSIKNDPDKFGKIYFEVSGNKYNDIITEQVNLFEIIQKINNSEKDLDLKNEIDDLQHKYKRKQYGLTICFEQINQLHSLNQELQHRIENILH